ncbi:zeta toxin family protein [Nevskia ramosa]|uniref:zeta toxin family protein n=1 Tax=Nevskia ramosa TaxID=64002 RepID=UPI002356BE43|nr:zeta toxin family protein [Nevskia ramosa]
MTTPRCILIGGPNGAGKTTFAREYVPNEAGIIHFVNADLIAAGLSPLKPELAALAAGRLVISELERLVAQRADFAFESTLSGLGYIRHIETWKAAGYRIEMVFLRIESAELAMHRVADRVKQGGHHVPDEDVIRRLSRSYANFETRYKALADHWELYDSSQQPPRLLELGP